METIPTPQINYIRLEQLRQVIINREAMEKQEKELSRPELDCSAHMKTLYERFNQVIVQLPLQHKPDLCTQRKLFLFIALYLYAPDVLTGKKLDKGMRVELAQTMGLVSCRSVTHYCKGVGMWYMYPDFRQLLDYVYARVRTLKG